GYDPDTGVYDTTSWQYEGVEEPAAGGHRELDKAESNGDSDDNRKSQSESEHSRQARGAAYETGGHGASLHHAEVQRDETLQDPRCVFQVLKRHYARYTPDLIARTCGVSEEAFLKVCRAVTANSGRERTTAFVYSVGWTHHSVGVQYI